MDASRSEIKPGLTVARLQRLAKVLSAAVTSELAGDFLNATSALPWVQPRKLYQEPESKVLYPSSAIGSIPADKRWKLHSRSFDEQDFYEGRYGLPLAYASFVDALPELGVRSVSGKRVLDIGYGSILPLRLMACLGAKVTGIDSDKFPAALYGFDGDTGAVRAVRGRTIDRTRDGSVEIRTGRLGVDWTPVAGSFDLILSRNTLKNGYVHPKPEHALEPNVKLKLSDADFLIAVRTSLAKGGLFVTYNTYDPRDTGPGADARSPFSKDQFAAAGFEVLAFEQVDDDRYRTFVDVLRSAGAELTGPLASFAPRALLTATRAV